MGGKKDLWETLYSIVSFRAGHRFFWVRSYQGKSLQGYVFIIANIFIYIYMSVYLYRLKFENASSYI